MIITSDETKIFDPISERTRTIKNIHLQSYDVPDESGKEVTMAGVEFIVIGARHEWPLWLPLAEFCEANPQIDKKDLR